MRISFTPQRRPGALSISASGDVLTINGDEFDLSQMGEGDVLPADAMGSEWFVGHVTRIDGEIHATLIKPHGPKPTMEEAFPEPVTL